MRKHILGVLSGLFVLGMAAALAQAPTPPPSQHVCGGTSSWAPQIAPDFVVTGGDFTNIGFDCMVWQDFVYLNWPALPGQRGMPNKSAAFGGAAPTVWETYKTVDEVFLPNGSNPGPWNMPPLMITLSAANPDLARRVAAGAVRHLTLTSKISPRALTSIMRDAPTVPQNVLDEISQAGGGILYDLNGRPVYYEVAMNMAQYDYIVQNGLYNSDTQRQFAKSHVIDLPASVNCQPNGPCSQGAIEVKAAWKVLSTAEQNSGRFHMIDAVIDGLLTPVKVGLVGFHIFFPDGAQGVWATFAQVDNAPMTNLPGATAAGQNFNFFNPACSQDGSPCPINVKDADPGQVVQIFADDGSAVSINTYMQKLIVQTDANSPWQFYKLVNVQWEEKPVLLSKLPAPKKAPLPDLKPNTPTIVNAVLETFLQRQGVGCFFCHKFAQTAGSEPAYATSYTFMFGHATAPSLQSAPR